MLFEGIWGWQNFEKVISSVGCDRWFGALKIDSVLVKVASVRSCVFGDELRYSFVFVCSSAMLGFVAPKQHNFSTKDSSTNQNSNK